METKKDFRLGDPVTVILAGPLEDAAWTVEWGFVKKTLPNNRMVEVSLSSGVRWAVGKERVFHGHNVTVKVEGEELPERLKVEAVEVVVNTFPGHGICHKMVHGFLNMPADIAKQYLAWLKDQGEGADL